jgi:glycosyltransferase involved in cell wall biosynthesis
MTGLSPGPRTDPIVAAESARPARTGRPGIGASVPEVNDVLAPMSGGDGKWPVVLAVNARAGDRELHGGGGRDQRRSDFTELAAALGADVVDWDTADRSWFWRILRKRFGFGPVAAAIIFARRRSYAAAWCFTEIEGLLLALLFKIFRIRRVLFIIGIEVLSPKAIFLMKHLRIWTHFTAILPTSSYQAGELCRRAGVPPDKVIVLPYQVDCGYFAPRTPPARAADLGQGNGAARPYVVAAGLESRDYATLISAVEGLDADVKIAADSLWSGRKRPAIEAAPPRTTVGSYRYAELRELYAGAALAVVPLHEAPYQHGITALQEAMAMGLPVIVTRTAGQSDVVIDRRKVLRAAPQLQTDGGFAQRYAPARPDLQECNGFYVGVGDVETLRETIRYLLGEPELAAAVGRQARRFAEEVLSIDWFVARAVRLVTAACNGERICADILTGTAGVPVPGGLPGDYQR